MTPMRPESRRTPGTAQEAAGRPARRRAGVIALSAILTIAGAVPAFAATGGSAATVELEGTLADVHADTFNGTVRHETHLVLPGGRSVILQLPETAAHPTPGAQAAVRGTLRGNALAVAPGGFRYVATAADEAPAVAAGGAATATAADGGVTAAATVTKRLAVILINFADDTRTPWSVADTEAAFFAPSPAKSVRTFYEEQSYGAWETTGDVLGYYTITADRTACNYGDWGSKGRAAATAAGVNLSQYTNVVHVWPGQAACGWAGLAYLPGTYSFLDGNISVYVATHELGHNYGAHHASTVNCTEAGVRVTLSATAANCSASEYGDPFDTMGAALQLSHTWHRKQEAQLTAAADQLTVSTAGQYSIGVANDATPSAHRIVRIARGIGDGTFFYLEYRQPGGLFETPAATAPVANGILVRMAPDTSRVQSRLLDMTPATTTFSDAPLLVGQSFTDPATGMTVTLLSIGAESAVVDVSYGADAIAPSAVANLAANPAANGTMPLSWTAATDNRGVAGYEISRDGTVVTTTAATSWTDTGVAVGTQYTWSVRAYDAAGNFGPASEVTATTRTPDTIAPDAPTNLAISAGTRKGTWRLSWSASTDNVAVTGYRIYDGGRLIASLSASTLSYQYKPARGSHSWTVRAIDAAGNLSAASNTVTRTL